MWGGTKTECGIYYPGSGKFRKVFRGETPKSVEGMVELVADHAPKNCKAIGVGFPGKKRADDTIFHAPNNQWAIGTKLFKVMSRSLNLPVFDIGDVDGAAWGVVPKCLPDGRSLLLTGSTGINSAYIVNGVVVGGSETGHECIDYSPLALFCLCELQGCAEAYASGTAAAAFVERELFLMKPEEREKWRPVGDNNKILDQAYLAGQRWAQRIYCVYVVPSLGRLIATIHNNTPFEELWWMGSFAQHMLKLPGMSSRLRHAMYQHMVNKAPIKFRMLPKNAPVLGPAIYAYKQLTAA